jgi:hypothetical protein
VAIFIGAYTTIAAADTLVIGCRPWDEDIQTVNGLSQAHFVDFRADGAPAEAPNFIILTLMMQRLFQQENLVNLQHKLLNNIKQ